MVWALHKGSMGGSGGGEEHHHRRQPSDLPVGFQSAASPPPMIASSTMSKESVSSYDMAEFDQSAIFLYLDGHDQASIQEQRQTLNIFPSQPMHAAEPIPAKVGNMGMVTAMLANANHSSPKRPEQGGQRSLVPSPPGPSVAAPKENKSSGVTIAKKEGTSGRKGAAGSSNQGRVRDPKTLRRLAQNREAARKSRLRKKAYIQQLETSRIRLSQLEQQVQTARVQGVFSGTGGQLGFPSASSPAAAMFDLEYGRWVEEHSKLMFQLRAALNEPQLLEDQLQGFVNAALAQHEELLNLKGAIARADVFHLLSGVWASPAERGFLWLGGFRPSEVIKVALKHVEPLSEGQILGIYNFQQSVQEKEDALSRGIEAIQNTISDIVAAPEIAPTNFMGHMSLAMNKAASMEGLVRQADGLRQQTLHKLHEILTTHQAGRCLVAIADYFHRLRALSTLWVARPRQDEGPGI